MATYINKKPHDQKGRGVFLIEAIKLIKKL